MSADAVAMKDRVVMITGATGNLGRAVATAFAARGATLVLVGRERNRLAEAFGSEGERLIFAPADLADADATARAVDTALVRCERIDVLCNLAGGFRMAAVHETSNATLDFLIDANVRSLLNAVRAVVPQMLTEGGGKVVNVAANAAQRGGAQMGAYAAAKSAVIRLTEAMAAELRGRGVNVNCVLPSIIDTPENRAAMPEADPSRWVSPMDLAEVVVFLASEAARAVHGAAIPVTGLS